MIAPMMLEIKFYIFKAINPDLALQASEAVSEGGWFTLILAEWQARAVESLKTRNVYF